MNDTVNTHDLLRPTATRATGTRAWVWYVAIGGFALVIVIYLTNVFMSKPPSIPQASAAAVDAAPIAQAADQFRYTGHVISHVDPPAARTGAAGSGPASKPTPPLPTVAPVAAAPQPTYGTANYAQDTNVPDVSGATAAYERIHLPSPAPLDGIVGGTASTKGGIQVVYGAAATGPDASVAPNTGGQLGTTTAPFVVAAAQAEPTTPATGGLAGPSGETMPGRRRAPTARYMVTAGTKIYASLEGYVQSDMPGPVTAKVSSPAIDQLTGEVLIPAGSEVLGYYGGLAQNTTALNISWTRLIFPDQSSVALDKLPALNEDGHMGVSGSYDDHRGKLFRSTLIGAVLAGVAQRFLGTGTATTNIYVSTGSATQQQPYAASLQMVLDLVNRLNARDDQALPTIVLPANTPVEIYVDRDMIFDGPYRPMKAASS